MPVKSIAIYTLDHSTKADVLYDRNFPSKLDLYRSHKSNVATKIDALVSKSNDIPFLVIDSEIW